MLKTVLGVASGVALTVMSTVSIAAAQNAPVQSNSGVRFAAQAVRPSSAVPYAASSTAVQGEAAAGASAFAGAGLSTAVIVVGGVSLVALSVIVRNIAKENGNGNGGSGAISRG